MLPSVFCFYFFLVKTTLSLKSVWRNIYFSVLLLLHSSLINLSYFFHPLAGSGGQGWKIYHSWRDATHRMHVCNHVNDSEAAQRWDWVHCSLQPNCWSPQQAPPKEAEYLQDAEPWCGGPLCRFLQCLPWSSEECPQVWLPGTLQDLLWIWGWAIQFQHEIDVRVPRRDHCMHWSQQVH